MQLIYSTTQIERDVGMSTTSSVNIGIDSNHLAVQISNLTDIDLESI